MRARVTACAVATLLLAGCGGSADAPGDEARQAAVREAGAEVMPFDLDATLHSFVAMARGGLQTVVARDPADDEQVALVREHLREAADQFAAGRFDQPAAIHGHDMPGLAVLREHAGLLSVTYSEIPGGAVVEYLADDANLVEAVHLWFQAQLADHGDDATHEHLGP